MKDEPMTQSNKLEAKDDSWAGFTPQYESGLTQEEFAEKLYAKHEAWRKEMIADGCDTSFGMGYDKAGCYAIADHVAQTKNQYDFEIVMHDYTQVDWRTAYALFETNDMAKINEGRWAVRLPNKDVVYFTGNASEAVAAHDLVEVVNETLGAKEASQ